MKDLGCSCGTMKSSAMTSVLLGALVLYIVALAIVRSVTKMKSDLEKRSPLKIEEEPGASAQLSELHSLHDQAMEGLRSSTIEMKAVRNSLFKEGNGLQKFKFMKEGTLSNAQVSNIVGKNDQKTLEKVSSTESTRFGLPLKAPPRSQQMRATTRENLMKSNSGESNTNEEVKMDMVKNRIVADADETKWAESLKRKISCLHNGIGGIFLYHVRKAAGTSIRDVLEQSCTRWHVGYYEVEGLSLDTGFLEFKAGGSTTASLLSVLTLRDPVERALSLYWYEHVGWWDGIQMKTEKCHTLAEWIATWRDSSDWKKGFMKKNPRTVYVEIENYYVKMLTGWTGPHVDGPLTEQHLEQAKRTLDRFDVLMLMEWMNDASQIDALNALFPGRNMVATRHMVKGDKKAKERLLTKLAPNEADMRELLKELNSLDVQLFDYAEKLAARRLREVPQLVWDVNHPESPIADKPRNECGVKIQHLPPNLSGQLGIHQPPGHKAPL